MILEHEVSIKDRPSEYFARSHITGQIGSLVVQNRRDDVWSIGDIIVGSGYVSIIIGIKLSTMGRYVKVTLLSVEEKEQVLHQ